MAQYKILKENESILYEKQRRIEGVVWCRDNFL